MYMIYICCNKKFIIFLCPPFRFCENALLYLKSDFVTKTKNIGKAEDETTTSFTKKGACGKPEDEQLN